MKAYRLLVLEQMKREDAGMIRRLEDSLTGAENGATRPGLLLKMVSVWEQTGNPVVAGHYAGQFAGMTGNAAGWARAAGLFFSAANSSNDASLSEYGWVNSIACYKKALAAEPGNSTYRTGLALCYTESGRDVMKGVGILLDIVKHDTAFADAYFHLGRLALRSGQYDKAIQRLEKATGLVSDNAEPFLYLGKAYAARGDRGKALKAFLRARELTGDYRLIEYIDAAAGKLGKPGQAAKEKIN